MLQEEVINLTQTSRKVMRARRRRQKKLHYLRLRLAEATNTEERKRLIAKMGRISPRAPVPEA